MSEAHWLPPWSKLAVHPNWLQHAREGRLLTPSHAAKESTLLQLIVSQVMVALPSVPPGSCASLRSCGTGAALAVGAWRATSSSASATRQICITTTAGQGKAGCSRRAVCYSASLRYCQATAAEVGSVDPPACGPWLPARGVLLQVCTACSVPPLSLCFPRCGFENVC